MIELDVFAYGFKAYTQVIDPCTDKTLKGMCPMNEGPITMNSNAQIPKSSLEAIPGKTMECEKRNSASH